jgi:hypothetical protein
MKLYRKPSPNAENTFLEKGTLHESVLDERNIVWD